MPELPYSADCVGYREEYALVHVESAEGAFVGEIRRAYEKVLVDVSKQCFDTEVLKADQTKRNIHEKYRQGDGKKADGDRAFVISLTLKQK